MPEIRVKVNEEWRTGIAKPGQTLLDFLRKELFCTEVKHGCGRGDCGACTVIMNGQAVDSCLVLALQAEGADIVTAKGLGTKKHLHPLQKAFIEKGALQCGFCTPGMIMAAVALIDRNPEPSRDEILAALGGNLCRCGSYNRIIRAIEA
ncbi:(2Fe-2S)-binding protein, partial [bacterium]|nr:(2Fe-2S)-binding protein [bacterium]